MPQVLVVVKHAPVRRVKKSRQQSGERDGGTAVAGEQSDALPEGQGQRHVFQEPLPGHVAQRDAFQPHVSFERAYIGCFMVLGNLRLTLQVLQNQRTGVLRSMETPLQPPEFV